MLWSDRTFWSFQIEEKWAQTNSFWITSSICAHHRSFISFNWIFTTNGDIYVIIIGVRIIAKDAEPLIITFFSYFHAFPLLPPLSLSRPLSFYCYLFSFKQFKCVIWEFHFRFCIAAFLQLCLVLMMFIVLRTGARVCVYVMWLTSICFVPYLLPIGSITIMIALSPSLLL